MAADGCQAARQPSHTRLIGIPEERSVHMQEHHFAHFNDVPVEMSVLMRQTRVLHFICAPVVMWACAATHWCPCEDVRTGSYSSVSMWRCGHVQQLIGVPLGMWAQAATHQCPCKDVGTQQLISVPVEIWAQAAINVVRLESVPLWSTQQPLEQAATMPCPWAYHGDTDPSQCSACLATVSRRFKLLRQ
eukprot:1145757-Pelagomonas_calceolata.AAC.13